MGKDYIDVYDFRKDEEDEARKVYEYVLSRVEGDERFAKAISERMINSENFRSENLYSGKYDVEIEKRYNYYLVKYSSIAKSNEDKKKVPVRTFKNKVERSLFGMVVALAIGVAAFGGYQAGKNQTENEIAQELEGYLDEDLGVGIVAQNTHSRMVNTDNGVSHITYYDGISIGSQLARICQDNPEKFDIAINNIYHDLAQYAEKEIEGIYKAARGTMKDADKNPVMSEELVGLENFDSYLASRDYLLKDNPEAKKAFEKLQLLGKDSLSKEEKEIIDEVKKHYQYSQDEVWKANVAASAIRGSQSTGKGLQ